MQSKPFRKVEFWKYWFPLLGYMLTIFFLSSQSSLPQQPEFIHFDKICHLIEFGILGYLSYRAFVHSNLTVLKKNALLLAIIFTILFGISDEFHQFFVPLRQPDVYDIMADSFGTIIGTFSALLIDKKILKKKGMNREA